MKQTVNKSGYATLLTFFPHCYLKNLRFLRPFVRVREEFLRESSANLHNVNRRGIQPLASVDLFGSFFAVNEALTSLAVHVADLRS